jgi:hypothetical protein
MEIDINKQYKTREGKEVRIYSVDTSNINEVHGAVLREGGWYIEIWNIEGDYLNSGSSSNYDLVEVKPTTKITQWLNIFHGGRIGIHPTRETADESAAILTRAACIEINLEYKEGEGL